MDAVSDFRKERKDRIYSFSLCTTLVWTKTSSIAHISSPGGGHHLGCGYKLTNLLKVSIRDPAHHWELNPSRGICVPHR